MQVMQNAALRTATGCTQDTNIQHLHDKTLTLQIHEHLQLHASQYKLKTQHPLHKHTSTLQAKNTIFNNGRYTTNMRHIHSNIHLLSLFIKPQEAIIKYCAHLHPPHNSSSEERLPHLTRCTLAQFRTSSILYHYAPSATPTISSTGPTYAPHQGLPNRLPGRQGQPP